jgi:hypothetical protein
MGMLGRLARALGGGGVPRAPILDGFVDSVLQSFENCRPGLADETLAADPAAATAFFVDLYEREMPRLLDTIRLEEPHLSPEARAEYARRIDTLFRKVVVPAYVRMSVRFTRRERNGFYVVPDPFHPLERVLTCLAGVLVGGFVVWAPFIPLWEKTWVLPFALGGLFVPEVRRALALKGYEAELNRLVDKAEAEIGRIDTAYLTSPEALSERTAEPSAAARAAHRVREGS